MSLNPAVAALGAEGSATAAPTGAAPGLVGGTVAGRGAVHDSSKWIAFLRKYGPIPTNDNMYDEVIQRAMRRSKIAPITLPTAYLAPILENFRAAEPCSVVLTGTAGDGKTYHCRQVWLEFGGTEEDWNRGDPVQRLAIPAGELVIIKDLTELGQQEGAEVIEQMAEDLVSSGAGRFYLIAANHGQLIDKWKTAASTTAVLSVGQVVEDLLVTGESQEPAMRLQLYNLSAQSGAEMLPKVLDEVLNHPGWGHCTGCPLQQGTAPCPIWENRARLSGEQDSGLLRHRLGALAELSEQNGVHFPIRHLLLLTANMILGHPGARDSLMTCNDVPSIIARGDAHLASVYRNVFGENLSPRRREATDVFEKLARFGIGHETSNQIDSVLVYGADDPALRPLYQELVLSDAMYGGTVSWQNAQRAYLEGDEGVSDDGSEAFLQALRAQRQRLFFTLPDERAGAMGLWELTVYRYAGLYLELVDRVPSKQSPPRAALPLLVRGLNRIFTGMLLQNPNQIVIGTSGSHSQSKTSRLLDSTISVPRDRGEEVLLVPYHHGAALSVQLVRQGEPRPVVLPLTLLRFEFLCRVAEGALPSSFSLECYEDLLAFKANLLRALERRRELDGGVGVTDDLVLQFIDVTADGFALPKRVEVRLV